MIYKGLPIFDVEFSDETSVFRNVALVTEPAIQETFIQLAKQEEGQIQLKVDEEKRIVSGPVLIPDQPIYRNQGGRAFYIKYTKETIERLAQNFFKTHKNTEGNVEHQIPVNGITYFESYLVNKDRGISPKEFDLPDGTWFMSCKVENDDVWELVKNGELTGFSVDLANVSLSDEKVIDKLEELIEYLKKY